MYDPKRRPRGSVETSNREYPKSVAIARCRVEPERHEKYLKAFAKRSKEITGISFSWCVREALDAWSDLQLRKLG